MSAIISDCEKFRYRLDRTLAPISIPSITALVVMVNPSTADAEQDDPTIVKLRGFGERYGWSKLIVGNLFAYRATDVRELASADDPVGPDNDWHLVDMLREADQVIFAWGASGKLPMRLRSRVADVIKLQRISGRPAYSFGSALLDGHPAHPVRLAYSNAPQLYLDPETARLMQ